jgi:histidinol dehydrogenase
MRVLSAAEFLRQRATDDVPEVRPDVRSAVERIVQSVRRGGDASLRELTATLDGVRVKDFKVPKPEWEKAWKRTPDAMRKALELSARNIRRYQSSIRPGKKSRVETAPGVSVTTEWTPLPSVACYAPGGRAAYPSTVLMMAVTARVAGVEKVMVASPPREDGRPSPTVLAAAHLAQVDEVYALGGAQAVAAFAFGTETVPRAPKIVGPGNAYVTEAKRQLYGTIGIDGLAGPTELAIYSDGTADPLWVAADLCAQAEHDPDARCILVVGDAENARAVQEAANTLVLNASRKGILRTSLLEQGQIVISKDLDEAARVLDAFAPEHVEILAKKPEALAQKLRNAGTVFLGPLTPAPLGDYVTGANHVLPTGRSARWASPLSVYDFLRQNVHQKVDAKGIAAVGPAGIELGSAEGLSMHAEAIRRRQA